MLWSFKLPTEGTIVGYLFVEVDLESLICSSQMIAWSFVELWEVMARRFKKSLAYTRLLRVNRLTGTKRLVFSESTPSAIQEKEKEMLVFPIIRQ